MAAYTQWRQLCGLPAAGHFRDLNTTMTPAKIDMLRSMYRSVQWDTGRGASLDSNRGGAI